MSSLDWNTNYWDFKPKRVHAPEPKARVPKPVPEPERLFTLQRHALDMLHMIRDLQAHVDDKHAQHLLNSLEAKAENNYRVINTYLKHNVAPSQGQGELGSF